jgi:preprotein translocase subunit SecD
MGKNVTQKLLLSVGVLVVFFAVGIYPLFAERVGLHGPKLLLDKKLKLGLDLKGGVHLVLRVQTDDALKVETESEAQRLRDELQRQGVSGATVTVANPTEFVVEGVPPGQDAAVRNAANEVAANFNRGSGAGGRYTFTMKPNIVIQLRDEAVEQALRTIDNRINELGVTEPNIAIQGDNGDQLIVQLPGVTDINRAKEIIRSTGLLELKLVEQGPYSTREAALQAYNNNLPPDLEILPGNDSTGGGTQYYVLRRAAAVSGRDLRSARPSLDQNNQPAVSFTLNSEGGRRFAKVTGDNIGRSLAIVLDGRVQSAPRIDGRIETDGQIFGSFTQQEVADLALVLRSGALPATLTYLEERVVGPTLGADSIRSGIIASVVGLVLIVVFMLIYYQLSGVNAVVALMFNLVILLGLMAYMGATMTLPGIAGFVLTMGIGVDSNVLIFERIKEELEAQRGVRAAINAGFSRVFLTLLDTHICALISAAFLFQFGTGPIRGFAVTLFVGLVSNLFTSTFVSKTLFEAALARRQQVATLSI